jgi:resolvase-like protein
MIARIRHGGCERSQLREAEKGMSTAVRYARAPRMATQRLALRHVAVAACRRHGLIVVGQFVDLSHGLDAPQRRPGFAALLARLTAEPITAVVTTDGTQLARPTPMAIRGFAAIEAAGAQLLTLDQEAAWPALAGENRRS